MNVLVTGGTGFIGCRLVERLRSRGDSVVCVAKDPLNIRTLEALGVTTVLGDLNNHIDWAATLPPIEIVYHVAGVTRASRAREYYEGNTEATRSLLAAVKCHAHHLRRFLYVSSQTAAGPSLDGAPINEEAPCHPVSDYGRSKYLAEQLVLQAADTLPITIVRPSAVYGPRERDMYDYMRTIQHGIHLLIGFKRKYVCLIHVDDLVDGVIRAAESPQALGQIYFLGSERVYDEEEVGKAIAEAVRCNPIRVHVPHTAAYVVGAVGDVAGRMFGKQVFMNIQKVREIVQTAWSCSVDKARAQIGYHQHISLADGMKTTYAWYHDNGWL